MSKLWGSEEPLGDFFSQGPKDPEIRCNFARVIVHARVEGSAQWTKYDLWPISKEGPRSETSGRFTRVIGETLEAFNKGKVFWERTLPFEGVLKVFENVELQDLRSEPAFSGLIDFLVETRYAGTGYDLEALKWFYKNHKGVYILDEEGAKEVALLYKAR